jgi:hypothetical protein
MRRRVELIQHAVWLAVAGSGTQGERDEQARRLLMQDGWTPDGERLAEAGFRDSAALFEPGYE